ncbi:2OG-Fe(II) oxygenase [Qipengyuania sediminis]|uniref:2OG-Fe(II) oxygenase n=1 Tax=Qipengyuania sediminis TaxID=1532023 RepID=UPI001059D88D|nr:2OG-Fe(II) oxygenase family protein [Qipengyuania sediminis]
MSGAIRLLDLNPRLDRASLAKAFAAAGRVQIRDVLTAEAARNLHRMLAEQTPWGLAWHAGADGPYALPAATVQALPPEQRMSIQKKLSAAASGRDYAFIYGQYPMVHAYLERWAPGGPHDLTVELLNDDPLMNLVRDVTGTPQLIKVDAQATLYGPGSFLSVHDDSHVAQGWRIAYVLNLCAEEWRPEWGGYLNFYDDAGDIVQGFRPRFNALNLFRVPQRHAVGYVPPFAPQARYAITGWFRDR